ncbi:MAG: Transcriptional regulator, TrmB [uncultured bacterium]|nr:MAG: Transcriptional regulator, TrmB [uncultured bacterium]
MKNELIELGFNDKEANVYLALLEIGETPAGKIISKTHYHREIVYTALKHLEEKNLVTYIRKKGRRFYSAASPQRILEMVENNFNIAKKIIPDLEKLQQKTTNKQFIQIWSGSEGVIQAREFMIRRTRVGGEIRILGASGWYFKNMGDYSEIWHKKRAQKKIKYMVQLYEPIEDKTQEAFKNFEYIEIKSLPEKFEMPSSTAIFEDCVIIQIWGDEPVMVLIENEKVAKSYKDTFDMLWKISR